MKKAAFFAAAILAGLTVTAMPIQAKAASLQGKGTQVKVITANRVISTELGSLKDCLESNKWKNRIMVTLPCKPGDWNGGNGTPDTETPDDNTPEIPDIETPDTPDNSQPEIPDGNVPETPDTETPDTETPGEDDTTQQEHAYVLRIVELVNEERAKAGLNPLTLQKNVTAAAQVRAVETETLFSHTRPNGTSFSTALKEAGVSYRGSGENIAWGQKTPEQVMQGWMNSAGHRANILNSKYTSIGVGYHQNAAGVNYWSQLFTY